MNFWIPGSLYFTNVVIATTLLFRAKRGIQVLRTSADKPTSTYARSNQQRRRNRRDQRTKEIYRIIIQHPTSLQQRTQKTVSDHANNRRKN